MHLFGIDIETHATLPLQTVGASAYIDDIHTRVLMAVFHAIGSEDKPILWCEGNPVPRQVHAHVVNGGQFTGWNAIGFDRLGYAKIMVRKHGFPPIDDDNWKDSMHLAAAANLPRGLDACAKAVGVQHDAGLKDQGRIRRVTDANRTPIPGTVAEILDYADERDAIIHHMATRAMHAPASVGKTVADLYVEAAKGVPSRFDLKLIEDLRWLRDRCIQDVAMEEAVLLRLPPWPGMAPWLSMPAIDRKINDRGVMIDLPLVRGLARAAAIETTRLNGEMAALTGGEVPRTTNIESLKAWLVARGVELPRAEEPPEEGDEDEGDDETVPSAASRKSPWRLRKSDVADLLARDDVPEECRLALDYRQEAAKASTAKLRAMIARADQSWRLRNIFLLGGAQQTLRFSSTGVQLHNTLRDTFANHDDIAETNILNAKTDAAEVARLSNLALATGIDVGRQGDPDVMRALYETKRRDAQGRIYHSGVLSWISRMIRRTITVPRGMLLLNGDWAQVEARITVWLSQQRNVLDAFAKGEDVYRIAAAGIFGRPPDTITKLERQTGKVCVAEGSLVLTDQGLVPIEKVTASMKVWDGVEWVPHSGAVCNGYAETIEYDGLCATSDHLVWADGWDSPMEFGIAATCQIGLARTGYGRRALRLGNHNIAREKRGQPRQLVRSDPVQGVRKDAVDLSVQPTVREVERVSTVHASTTNTDQIRPCADGRQNAVSKLPASEICGLRRPRDSVSVHLDSGSRPVGDEDSRRATRSDGVGSKEQRRSLRTRQPSVGNQKPEPSEHADKPFCGVRQPASTAASRDSRYSSVAAELSIRGQHVEAAAGRLRIYRGPAGSDRQAAAHGKTTRRVWDILNAGPRNRFTVSGRLVHNCILALGFGGGPNALVAMARNYGILMSFLEGLPIVKAWRDSNLDTKAYWYACDDAAAWAVQYPGREFPVPPLGCVSYFMQDDCLCCRLPSGRMLRYWQPRLSQDYWSDGRPKDRLSLSALTVKGRAVFRRSVYHTILVENQVQAIAADLLATALCNMDEAGLPVSLHVHDSIAAEVAENAAERLLPTFRQCMLHMPGWIGNLPVDVDAEANARFG